MTEESDALLGAGTPLKLNGKAPVQEVHLEAGMLTLKLLEDTFGSINGVGAAMFPTTPIDRVSKLIWAVAKGLEKREKDVVANDIVDALVDEFGSLEDAEIELAPATSPKQVGPAIAVLASCLMHEEALFQKCPWPFDDDNKFAKEKHEWLTNKLLSWTDIKDLAEYQGAAMTTLSASIPKEMVTTEKEETPTDSSSGESSTTSSPSDSAEPAVSSGV